MTTLKQQLEAKGFDVKMWPVIRTIPMSDALQITDSKGLTFYMFPESTIDECLERYEQKKQAFEQAAANSEKD